MRIARSWPLAALMLLAHTGVAQATNVTVETQLGTFEIELFDEQAPITVENFLNYIRDGDFEDSVIHRSVVNPDFVIQGGSSRILNGQIVPIPTDDPIQNEPGIPNTRGTIAMAKVSGDENSATSSWFINLVDNPNLDTQNGGFTVFGEVVGDGMTVVDAIADLPVRSLGVSGFTETPLYNWSDGEQVNLDNFVVTNFSVVGEGPFVINAGLNDSWFNPATDGQGVFFTVFPDLGFISLAWFTYDTERPDESVTAIIGEPGHRWITALGAYEGNAATMEATLTSGGIFDSGIPAVENTPYGTITVEFEDCNTANMTYDFPDPGLTGTVALQRVAPDNIPLCEALQDSQPSR